MNIRSGIDETAKKYIKGYQSAGEIKDKALENAIKKFAGVSGKDKIIGMLDTTLMSSGKSGFVFTEEGIYGSGFGSDKKFCPFFGISKILRKDDKDNNLVFQYNDGSSRKLFFSIYCDRFLDFFIGLASVLGASENGENVASEAKAENEENEAEGLKEDEKPDETALTDEIPEEENEEDYEENTFYEESVSDDEGEQPDDEEWIIGASDDLEQEQDDYSKGLMLLEQGRSKEAFPFIEKAADSGNGGAQYNLAVMFLNGEGVKENNGIALIYMKMAAENGNKQAAEMMKSVSGEILEQIAESERDFYMDKGIRYLEGYGVEIDYARALYYLKRASELGNGLASVMYGKMKFYGNGCEENVSEARRYFEKAAEQGNSIGKKILEDYEKYGEKTEVSFIISLMWQSRGEKFYEEGEFYEHGFINIRRDLKMALKYYKMAADEGYVPAYEKCAEFYAKGMGTNANVHTALDYYGAMLKTDYPPCAEKMYSLYCSIGQRNSPKARCCKEIARLYNEYKFSEVTELIEKFKTL